MTQVVYCRHSALSPKSLGKQGGTVLATPALLGMFVVKEAIVLLHPFDVRRNKGKARFEEGQNTSTTHHRNFSDTHVPYMT